MVVGASVRVPDAVDRVTGRVSYVANLKVPGMLQAKLLRSTLPHARLRRVEIARAARQPGVVAVLTGRELADDPRIDPYYGPAVPDQPILAIDRVRFVGDPVAAVVALDEDAARAALELIEVEYEELPAVFEPLEALAPAAPILHEQIGTKATFSDISLHRGGSPNTCNAFSWQRGDLDAAFAAADEVFEDTFVTPATQHVPLEPHGCLAYWERGRLVVHSSTQTPHVVRAQLADTFGLPLSAVRVIVPTLGGGYGAKAYPKLEPLTAALAWRAGRPVKLLLTRAEEFVTLIAHPTTIRLRTAVTRDGRFLARDVQAYWNTGAYADIGVRVPKVGSFYCLGPYRYEAVRLSSSAVYTNLPPAGAFRGYAGVQATWAHERQTDLIARRLGIDPLELRLKNLLRPGERFASGEVIEDAHWKELLEVAAQGIGWQADGGEAGGVADATEASGDGVRLRGKGLAVSMLITITPATSSAIVKLNEDGSATILSSTVEMGQGSRTVLSQICAEALGLPLERVAISDPDTDATPYDVTTTASRSTVFMGQAVRAAAEDARAQLLRLAGDLLEVAPDDLQVQDGQVMVRGLPDKCLSFGQVIQRTGAGDLTGRGTSHSVGGWNAETGEGRLSSQWHQGAVGAEVAVDPETGAVEVTRLHLAAWLGRVVNPVLTSLQNEGNASFGIGQALTEELAFDNGQPLNANLGDYLIPSFEDLPKRLSTAALEDPGPDAEMHGLGETTLPQVAPAIANAIQAATGAALRQLPLTPERVLRALQERDAG